MRLWGWRVATAPARAGTCFRCDVPIAEGELVVVGVMAEVQPFDLSLEGEVIDEVADGDPIGRYHVPCAVDVDLDAAIRCFRRSAHRESVRPALELARARVAVRRSLSSARVGGRRGGGEPPTLEPARDPFGRPRVRVLVLGSATTALTWTWEALQSRTRDGTIVSPLREYVLRGFSYLSFEDLHRDPSQPVVATVFASILDVKVVKAQRDKLASLRGLGLPTPLLWVLGRPESPDALDAAVGFLRSELDRVGFRGDDATVRSAQFVDDEALHDLALALDETVTAARAPRTLEDAVDRALLALEEALRDRELDRAASAMTSLADALPAAMPRSPRARERVKSALTPLVLGRIRVAATACLRVAPCRHAAVFALSFVGPSATALAEALEAIAEQESPRSLPVRFLAAWELLLEADGDRAWTLCEQLFAKASKPRWEALAPLWARCADARVASALRARAYALKPRDPRRAEAIERADEIDARAGSVPPS